MAATKDNVKSAEDLVQSFDNCCSTCSETGSIKEGIKFCIDCAIYFCDRCLQDHNKFPALRSHRTVDKCVVESRSSNGSTEADVPTERCSLHRGRVLDKFCRDHGEVCCEACVTINHWACTKVDNIEDAAMGIASSAEFKDVNDSLENAMKRIQLEQDKRSDHAANFGEKKKEILCDIDKFQDDLINRIKEIAKASRLEVELKHDELVQASNSDVNELETVLTVTKELSKKVKAVGQNEAELFTVVKHSKKIIDDVDYFVNKFSVNRQPIEQEYCFDTEVTETVLDLKSFGHFTGGNRPYIATNCKRINVAVDSDENTCLISSICIMKDDTYIVSDFKNGNLKRLNKNYHLMDNVYLNGLPSSLCTTGPQEVAAALRDQKKVQFVTCGETLSLGASFNTELRCTGLYFDSQCSELYVSCGAEWKGDQQANVNVYNKDGTLLRSYENDESGSRLFSSPNNIVMATSTGVVYVADRGNGLIAFTKSGQKLWAYSDPKLEKSWGVCILQRNQLLVTGNTSANILQIGADGKEVCELIGTSEGLQYPFAVTYDRKKLTIMVGCSADECRVFQLSKE